MSNELVVQCPYCGHNNCFDISTYKWKNSIQEVVTSLLAVRLGDHTSSYFVGQEWTEVGSLKGTLLARVMDVFNRTVGILRYPGDDNKVVWKEPICSSPSCNAPFEVFLTLVHSEKISQIWPHLTGVVNEKGEYSSWPIQRDFEKVFSFLGIPVWGETIVAIFILVSLALLSLLPNFYSGSPNRSFVESTTLRVSSAILVGFMLAALRSIGKELREKKNFLWELFEVKQKNSFIFWHNYMVARFAGADLRLMSEKNHQNRRPEFFRFTQAALLGGIPSVVVLLATWAIIYIPHISYFNYSNLAELIYWMVIAYISGMTALISLNFSVFMTQNISMLPMKLTPLNGYANTKPIRNITLLSLVSFIPIALLPLVFVSSSFVLVTQLEILRLWLLPWLMFVFAFLLFIIGIADRGMIIFALFYLAILVILIPSSAIWLPNQNISLGVFGVFWTALLFYQLTHAFSPLQKVLKQNQEAFIHTLDNQLLELTRMINAQNIEASGKDSVLTEIERILRLREIAMKAKTSVVNLSSIAGVFSPLFSSLIIPMFLEKINNLISNIFHI